MGNYDFVGIDLGASETRTSSNNGIVYTLPNSAVFVDNGERVDTAVKRGDNSHDEILGALDITITKATGAKCEHFPCRALMGDLAERYSATCTRPSVLKKKSEQKINFVSAIVAAAHQVYLGEVDSKFKVYLALPPVEVNYDKDKIAALLAGTYKVKFNKLDKEVQFEITKVICVEESFMALTTFFFGKNGKPTENATKFGKGYVLSLDIGASTTDVAVAKDMRYVEKSGQTFKTGCNVIQAAVANYVRGECGYDPTVEQLEEVLRTGRIVTGNKYKDISDALRRGKAEFARSIIEQLQSYFRLVNMPLQTIRAIVVSGGGSMESSYEDDSNTIIKTTGPVSDFITTELNNIVEGIEVLSVEGDPREANINGIYIRAMFDIMLEKAAESKK